MVHETGQPKCVGDHCLFKLAHRGETYGVGTGRTIEVVKSATSDEYAALSLQTPQRIVASSTTLSGAFAKRPRRPKGGPFASAGTANRWVLLVFRRHSTHPFSLRADSEEVVRLPAVQGRPLLVEENNNKHLASPRSALPFL